MKLLTFKDLKPGMVLYPVTDVNNHSIESEIFREYIVVQRTIDNPEDRFWGAEKAMSYISLHDAHSGFCSSAWRCGPQDHWRVVEDRDTIEHVKTYVRKELNWMREALNKVEELVNDC